MAHFAKLDSNNVVTEVVVVHNDVATSESAGVEFLNNLYGTSDTWKQTSYNTKKHLTIHLAINIQKVGHHFVKILLEKVTLMTQVEMRLYHRNLSIVGH